MTPRLRLGMVGGGQGAFIGAVHRMASRMTDAYDLVAGALSSTPERALASALELHIAANRSYGDFMQMARAESGREDGVEVVSIVTPNHLHFAACKAFLEAGIHVICDKPLTASLAESIELKSIAKQSGRLLILTHNYTGYPMVREARDRVARGALGRLRMVRVEYAQDWLARPVELSGSKQAEWRTDPLRAGAGGALGDIGTHAWNLAAFVAGETPSHLLADLSSFVEGRLLDDNAAVLLRYESGARGTLWASQIASGAENRLRFQIYGEDAGLEWSHEAPDVLWFTPLGQATQKLTRNGAGTGPASARVCHVPAGHPEGYLEAFATLYAEAARAINAAKAAQDVDPEVVYPTASDGVSGLAFVETCVKSSAMGGVWLPLPHH